MNDNFIEIEDVFINKDVIDTKFTCDLNKCKGACCTMKSDYGAPLIMSEIKEIEVVLPVVKTYLDQRHVEELEKFGFWEEKVGHLMTRSVSKRECIFVYYDGDIAKCAIEKAYRDGKIDFIKPISCHLFPIRVSDFGGFILKYEEYSECKPALNLGLETKNGIAAFCKDALTRAFGKVWYNKLISYNGN